MLMYGTAPLLLENGDVALNSKFQMTMITGPAKVVQDLKVLLRSCIGSYLFDTRWGVNFPAMIEMRENRALIESLVRDALERYQYLKAITAVTVTLDATRTMTIEIAIITSENERVRLKVTL
jgi:phage baseplate assembly protein W